MCGLDVLEANLFGTTDGLALDVFRAADPFGRVDDGGRRVETTHRRARSPARSTSRRGSTSAGARTRGATRERRVRSHVDVDADESETDTVVEVHADDDIGLLYRLASDVRRARRSTCASPRSRRLGTRVVDVFYVRDAAGAKIDDPDADRAGCTRALVTPAESIGLRDGRTRSSPA